MYVLSWGILRKIQQIHDSRSQLTLCTLVAQSIHACRFFLCCTLGHLLASGCVSDAAFLSKTGECIYLHGKHLGSSDAEDQEASKVCPCWSIYGLSCLLHATCNQHTQHVKLNVEQMHRYDMLCAVIPRLSAHIRSG